MNFIAPFGFYGWGNIGDESTLQGFARLVSRYKKGIQVWVGSRNPAHTKRVEPSFKYFKAVGRDPRRKWARFRSKACVIPGGTPIMDVLGEWPLCELAPIIKAARDQGKPVVFIGTGTEKLLRDESKRIFSEIIAPSVLHWSVRCTRDKERLVEYGVKQECVTVAADMAWMLEKTGTTFGKRYLNQLNIDTDDALVAVNVNNEKFVLDREPRLFEKLGAFLDVIVEKYGVRILFFCNEVRETEAFDRAASQKVLTHMKNRDRTFLLPNHYWSPQEMLSLIGCCHLSIGMRYHFCLFSALQDVPFIAIKRSGKVDDLCWDMNWNYGVSLHDIDVAALLGIYAETERNRNQIAKFLPERAGFLRERAQRNTVPLDALFGKLNQ